MPVWGISMFRDEGDVAYHTLMHMGEEGLAGIIVADNLSTDRTRQEIMRAQTDLAGTCEVVWVADDELAYYQSEKMTRLAGMAAEAGASWIIPFDADELWTSTDRVGVVLESQIGAAKVRVMTAELYNHFPTLIDPEGDNPFETIQWRQRQPGELPKVAFRWFPGMRVAQGNHSVQYADVGRFATRSGLEVRHFPYRTWEQFRHKAELGAAAYAATDLPETEGAHWRQYGALLERGEEHLRYVYERYFWFRAPVEAGLVKNPAPFRRWTREPALPAEGAT